MESSDVLGDVDAVEAFSLQRGFGFAGSGSRRAAGAGAACAGSV